MSSKKEAEFYETLGVEHTATEKEIVKAYRKKALACHPDKNPDNPKAAEEFHELTKALEVLTDAAARAAYDKSLKAKKAAELRHKELNSKRKKFKEDLEAREAAAQDNRAQQAKYTANLQEEITRLRKEGSRLVQEEKDRLLQEIRQERDKAQDVVEAMTSPGARLKVKWKASKADTDNGGYNRGNLSEILSKYGELSALLVSSKKNGSAVVEFSNCHDAVRAVQHETGLSDNPLTLSWLSGRPADPAAMERGDREPSPLGALPTDSAVLGRPDIPDSTDFESLVLRRMRQAEERKKLIEEMKAEDDDS